jgi:hypothetical protein
LVDPRLRQSANLVAIATLLLTCWQFDLLVATGVATGLLLPALALATPTVATLVTHRTDRGANSER